MAAADGQVVISTYSYSAGNYIMIDHGGGVSTVYMHCSQLLVSKGACLLYTSARVMKVREDGKLDLSLRERSYVQMGADAALILKVIDEFDGVLPFNDKARPEMSLREFHMSKNAFKRAVGRLLKEGKIRGTERTIERI